VPNVSKADSSKSYYESWGDSDDDDDQQSDDERTESDDDKSSNLNKTDTDERTESDDDKKPANKEKGDEEMTRAKNANAEHEEVSQEVVGDQVKDDAQTTVTAAPATQKTKVQLQSSSISSDYETKFLNFDNIPSGETKIISMMDIKVQHEDLSIQTSPLLTVHVTVIPKTSTAPATTIPPPIPPFISIQQQSTSIPTPTTIEATTSTTDVPDYETLSVIHLRVLDVEKEVKELKNVDHSLPLRATIKSEVLATVKEYLKTSLDDALYKVLQRHTADLSKEHSIPTDVVEKLKQQDKP
ncbi:hypothetical protein Tco_1478311, partial [Tanacetum coccineum]